MRGTMRVSISAGSPAISTVLLGAVIGDGILDELDEDGGDDRRDIEPAQIGQNAADRRQYRLGQPIERILDLSDDVVASVDDIESDKPAHDHHRHQDPEIDAED